MAQASQERRRIVGQVPYTLVITFADRCGACHRFQSSELETLKRRLDNMRVGREEFILAQMGGPYPPGVPKSHQRHIMSFPSFVLYKTADWNEAKKGNEVVTGQIYNGVIGASGYAQKNGEMPYHAAAVASWIEGLTGVPAVAANAPFASAECQGEAGKYLEYCNRLNFRPPTRR